MRVIAEGVVTATKEVGLNIVRLEGSSVAKGKEIINNSGLDIIAADDLDDAARRRRCPLRWLTAEGQHMCNRVRT